MKKVLFLLLSCMMMDLSAQKMEVLDSVRTEPDIMFGNKGRTEWRSEHMVFVLNDNNTIEWQILDPPHIFVSECSRLTGQDLGYSNARVGLFAQNDSLLAIVEKWKSYPSEHGNILRIGAEATFYRPDGTKMKGTIAHVWGTLKKRAGSYVRVVCNVYGDYYFEVKARMK